MRARRRALLAGLLAGCAGEDQGERGGSGGATGARALLAALPDAELGPDAAEVWAGASAPAALASATLPFVLGGLSESEPPGCPSLEETEGGSIYRGGCLDDAGNAWEGEAVVDDAGVLYRAFGFAEPAEGCPEGERLIFSGSVLAAEDGAETTFSADVRLTVEASLPGDCAPVSQEGGWVYSGAVEEIGERQVWRGSGEIGFSGVGVVSAVTHEEVIDGSLCGSEALSGWTEIAAGPRAARITYDGAADCDPESTATWTLDGQPMGEVSGVACAAAPAGAVGWLSAFAVLSALATRRRPARERAPGR